MDPLSIVAPSFALAGGIAKASVVLTEFSRDFSSCGEDLDRISSELQALSAILSPLSRILSQGRQRSQQSVTISQLVPEVDNTLHGCLSVVTQVEEKVRKYRNDKAWTKTKWVLFGQGDMQKLRESLEFYKVALGLGLHALSIDTGQHIKDDTDVIRTNVEAVMRRQDEILARVNSIRQKDPSYRKDNQVKKWIDEIALLSYYAESSYMETVVDPAEFTAGPDGSLNDTVKGDSKPPDSIISSTNPPLVVAQSITSPHKEGQMFKATSENPKLGAVVVGHARNEPEAKRDTSTGNEDRKSGPRQSVTAAVSKLPSRAQGPTGTSATRTYKPHLGSIDEVPGSSPTTVVALIPAQKEDGSVGHSLPPPNRKGADLGHLCVEGIGGMKKETEAITSLARPDKALIDRSQNRRRSLQPMHQEQLDQQLGQMKGTPAAESIRATILRGADPNSDAGLAALRTALTHRNIECLCALLRGGADPNARVNAQFLALPYAAYHSDERSVWALVSAGAALDAPNTWLASPTNGRAHRTHGTALLSALYPKLFIDKYPPKLGKRSLERQVRIVRFLLESGADPSLWIADSMGQPMHTPLSRSVLSWSRFDKTSTCLVAIMLLDAGAQVNLDLAGLKSDRPSIYNPFHMAAMYGNEELLAVLGAHVDPSRDSAYWRRAISCAARGQAWGCVKALMEPPYRHQNSLLYLIQDFMSPTFNSESLETGLSSILGWDDFRTAVEMLIDGGADPSKQAWLVYMKSRWYLGKNCEVSELISPLGLVKKIATDINRNDVREVISRRLAAPGS